MESTLTGLALSLFAIFAFGTYMVPLKRFPSFSPWSFLLSMSWGAFVSSAIAAFVVGWQPFYWTGVFCGLAWVVGAGSIFSAVQKEDSMGAVTVRAMGTSITVSFLLGAFYFRDNIDWFIAVPAAVLLLGGLIILDPKAIRNPVANWRSYLAGMVFGSYLAPWIPAVHGTTRFMLPLTMGIVIGSTLVYLLRRDAIHKVAALESAGAGILWTFGSIACYTSVDILGFTVGYPLSQLNLLVAIAWGIAAFGEFPGKAERKRVLVSALGLIAGGALLSFAKVA